MKRFNINCIAMLFALATQLLGAQQIQIVNMIPNAQSNETNQDSEPFLAVNPATPNFLVGSAFTPNPLGVTSPPSAPIFFSQDGGQTWVMNSIVPSGGATVGTGDITMQFGTTTNWLYSGILRRPTPAGANRTMDVLRTNNVTGTGLMQLLFTRNNPDQPYTHVRTASSGTSIGDDQVYIANNDLSLTNQTAVVDQSGDGGATTPTFATNVLEVRTTASQDMPPVRPTSHPDGTVYIGFERATTITNLGGNQFTIVSDIIVARDDNWGNGSPPYSDLLDPGDGLAGRIVVTGITYTFSAVSSIGTERGGSRIAIAVNPNNSNMVYLAWADNNPGGGNTINLHLRRTTDGGATWSANDIRTINNAINPEIAINNLGEVAFSYQQLTGGNWVTTLERSTNNFVTTNTSVLNTFPDGTPNNTFLPYLGDYTYLTEMPSGKDFVGVFSASNDPTPARFPTVQPTWQRNVNTATNSLRNLANTANVNISIDPYFYRVTPVAVDEDFYVRDWTKTSTDSDPGDEPSTENVFYRTSDIWNRRSDTPGTFNSNDQPANQNPRPVADGNNYVYARVHRKNAGDAKNVSLLFMKSEFGTGSNYELINGPLSFTTLPFSASDTQQTMPTGVEWNLIDPAAVAHNHVCIAVEIATPQDPTSNPSLLGRAPGWSNGTDLLVIGDNNKAQRNLEVFTGTVSGEMMSMYAVAHNAALFERDMRIILNSDLFGGSGRKYGLQVIGDREQGQSTIRRDTLILKNMKPCENRWIELSVASIPAVGSPEAAYMFEERVNEMTLNGFGMDVKGGKLSEAGEESLGEHVFAMQLLGKFHNIPEAESEAIIGLELLENGVSDAEYISFLKTNGLKGISISKAFMNTQSSDPFSVVVAGNRLNTLVSSARWEQAANAHGNLMRKLNAYLSWLDKSKGSTADILQTIRWFKDVVKRSATFKKSKLADEAIHNASEFIDLYGKRKVGNKDYPTFVRENLGLWREMVSSELSGQNFDNYFESMEEVLSNPQQLQHSHCSFTDALNQAVVY